MPHAPTLTVTRHASYDEVVAADVAGLAPLLWAALEELSGHPSGPAGVVPPFPPASGPTSGSRVPSAVGERLLAAVPPDAVVEVVDRRCPPAAAVDPARVAHRARMLRAVAAAVQDRPRGFITCPQPSCAPTMAALLAEAARPAVGVVLVRDGRQAEEVASWCRTYLVPVHVIRNPGTRADAVRPHDPRPAAEVPPGTWVVVPAGHPAWAAGLVPDPDVILAVAPRAATRPKILGRLFARPDQRVYTLVAADRRYLPADLHRLYAAFGGRVHDLTYE